MYALFPSFLTFFLSYIWLQAYAFGFNPFKWFTCCSEKNEGAEKVIMAGFGIEGRHHLNLQIGIFKKVVTIASFLGRFKKCHGTNVCVT